VHQCFKEAEMFIKYITMQKLCYMIAIYFAIHHAVFNSFIYIVIPSRLKQAKLPYHTKSVFNCHTGIAFIINKV